MYLRFWAAVLMTVVPAVPAADSEILPPVFGPIGLRPFLQVPRRAAARGYRDQLGRLGGPETPARTIKKIVNRMGPDWTPGRHAAQPASFRPVKCW